LIHGEGDQLIALTFWLSLFKTWRGGFSALREQSGLKSADKRVAVA
jgi:hypothetical protein